jgi:1-acyl-sn-glycerol-3-phosphate acyltransferase
VSTKRKGPGPWWRLAQVVILPLFSAFVTMRIRPTSSIPAQGPFIVAPNHYSEIDPIVMGVAVWKLGRTPRFLAKASLFRIPGLGFYLRKTGQIPVERDAGGSSAIDAAHRLMESGQGVIVYPEGTLTREPDLWPMRGKSGAIRMALEANIPLYPAAHWGTQMLMPRYGKKISIRPRPRIEVIVGEHMDLSLYQGKPVTKELVDTLTNEMMLEIQKLVAQLRGEKAPESIFQPGVITPGRSS